MSSSGNLLPYQKKLWCANRSSSINLTPFFNGKDEPSGTKDVYFPYVGQTKLMHHLQPALESYAGTIGKKSLISCQSFLSALFVFLTKRFPSSDADIFDFSEALIHEHALFLRNSTIKTRINSHSTGNQILAHLHARYSGMCSNLSKNGKPLRYPTIRSGSGPQPSRVIPIELEPYLKKYCLQVLKRVDDNPFQNVVPVLGTDVFNPAHVLHNYLQYTKGRLRGETGASWRHMKASDYPWKSTLVVTKITNTASELGRRIGELWCGGTTPQMREALFPTMDEIIASIYLITIDVGWVDTAKAFPIDGYWYTTTAKNPMRPATKEYVTLTPQIRPKTGKEVWSKASHTRPGGSWWVLKRMETRRVRLREICRQRADEISAKLDKMQSSDPTWDEVRLESDRWSEMERLAFIYASEQGAGSALSLTGHQYGEFLTKIPDLADFELPERLRQAFRKATHIDFRHLAAERTLRESGLFATQEFLGHAKTATTLNYLKSRQLKDDLFAIYSKITGIAFDEIEQKAILNRSIIAERYVRNGAQLTVDERHALGQMTLHGARCNDPASPPHEAGSLSDIRCIDGSCIRCPLAIWNWHDELAIPMAVDEYARLKTETLTSGTIADDADAAAWEALFSEIPPELQPQLKAELGRIGMHEKGSEL